MATVGNTATPSGYWQYSGTENQVASSFTMPSPGGLITALHGYFGAEASSGTGYLCLWDGSGNLLASVSVGSVPTGTNTPGGQGWHTATLSSPVFVAGGATIYLGFALNTTSEVLWSGNSSGSSYYNNTTIPGSFASHSSTGNGSLGAYADYTPGNAQAFRSSAWTHGPAYVERSGSETFGEAFVYRSGSWVAGS